MPTAPPPAIAWSWPNAAYGVALAVPAAAFALVDPAIGLPLAIGVVPAAALGVRGSRRQRAIVVLVGAVAGLNIVIGSLVAPVPVDAARKLGAARVVAVDVTFPPEQADLDDPFDALYQGFSILTRKLAAEERARADLVIAPPIPEHHNMLPDTIKAIVDAGERAAIDALPSLKRLFAR